MRSPIWSWLGERSELLPAFVLLLPAGPEDNEQTYKNQQRWPEEVPAHIPEPPVVMLEEWYVP